VNKSRVRKGPQGRLSIEEKNKGFIGGLKQHNQKTKRLAEEIHMLE
jgi:hypothetical protein